MFTHHGANPLLEETAAKLMSRSSVDANNDVVLISSDGNNNAKIKELRGLNPHAFLVVFQEPTGIRRMEYFRSGANMVSFSLDDCSTAMEKVKQHLELSKQTSELFSCPSCAKPNLSLTALWEHLPMYHVSEANIKTICPVCGTLADNIQVHVHNKHTPPGCHAEAPNHQTLYAFAIVVCRRPSDGKFLVVQEFADQGYWLPGGAIDPGENFFEAALRETMEEAGVHVTLKGIISIEFGSVGYARMRVIFYAEPTDDSAEPKTIPDFESAGAMWLSVEEVCDKRIPLRGREPVIFFRHVADGNIIHPLSIFSSE